MKLFKNYNNSNNYYYYVNMSESNNANDSDIRSVISDLIAGMYWGDASLYNIRNYDHAGMLFDLYI